MSATASGGRPESHGGTGYARQRLATPPRRIKIFSYDIFGAPADAQARFRTLELSATLSVDGVALTPLMERAVEAHRRRSGPRSAVLLFGPSGGESADESDRWTRQTLRITWAPPDRWREELIYPGRQAVVIIVRPGLSLTWISMLRTLYTSEPQPPVASLPDRLRRLFRRMRERKGPFDGMPPSTIAERVAELPLTNPRLPGADWALTTLGEETHLGRVVRRVRATRRPGAITALDEGRASGYWSWLNEYECLVDDELRLVLHLTGLADGAPVGIVSVDELRVDAPLAADAFDFVPPAGGRIVLKPL